MPRRLRAAGAELMLDSQASDRHVTREGHVWWMPQQACVEVLCTHEFRALHVSHASLLLGFDPGHRGQVCLVGQKREPPAARSAHLP